MHKPRSRKYYKLRAFTRIDPKKGQNPIAHGKSTVSQLLILADEGFRRDAEIYRPEAGSTRGGGEPRRPALSVRELSLGD
jgi:hypothetical protein